MTETSHSKGGGIKMKILTLFAALLAVCQSTSASDKPNFSGTWRIDGDTQLAEGILPAITIVQNESELRISDATVKAAADNVITCNTVGKQCEARLSGQPVKVSYWYNGPTLVEMLYEGKDNDRVVKTRRSLSDDGQKMTVEIIKIVPPGKPSVKMVFVRDQQVASGNTTAAP
jgi:hypothetical protein